MKVDVIILTDSTDEFMTQRTINSLINETNLTMLDEILKGLTHGTKL